MRFKFKAWDKEECIFLNIKALYFYDDDRLWYLQAEDDSENEIDLPYFETDLGKTWELIQFKGAKDRHGTEIYDSYILGDENGHRYYVDDENDWNEIKADLKRFEIVGNTLKDKVKEVEP